MLEGQTNVASAVMKSIPVTRVQKRAITIVYLLSRPLLEMDGGVQVQSDYL